MQVVVACPQFLVTTKEKNMSVGEGTSDNLGTIRARDYPTIRQFTVFSRETALGNCSTSFRRFEGSKVRIVALSDSRFNGMFRSCDSYSAIQNRGREILERAGLALIETDLIGVELPTGRQAALASLHRPAAGRG